ncbi:MAG TPA: diguanylate cyclase [Vicinamibacteria bacterium]|nr:diguanylate cyclase [Vicinamibacteria bacterium]
MSLPGKERGLIETATVPRRFRFGVQAKLLAVVVLCVVVPVVTLGVFLLRRNQEVLRERVVDGLSSHLLRKQAAFDDWMRDRAQEATRWSASFVVYEGLDAFARRAPESRAARDLKSYLASLLGHYRVYESLFIVNGEGEVLTGTRDETLEEWARPLVQGEVAFDRVIVSPLRKSGVLGRPTLLLLRPIPPPGKSERRGRAIGYFVERFDLREMESMLMEGATDLSPAPWLLDAEGRILARGGRVAEDPGERLFPLPAAAGGAAATVVAEAALEGLGPTVFGTRTLAGPFPGRLVATVPSGHAYASLRESRRGLILTGAAAAFMIAILNFVGARELLRPILLLSEGAKRVAAGDLDIYLPVRGRDEIGDLTRAFNDMAQRIREGRESLEGARDDLARANAGLRDANRTLETLATTDGLTSLFNRRHFEDSIEAELRRARQQERVLSLLLIDIDHFKEYNDRWGHPEGDAALRRVAAQVKKGIRASDMAFRYGGEELAILLPSCPKPQAGEVAEKLRNAIRAHPQTSGRSGGPLTVSIGVASFPVDARVAAELMDKADAALYAAKAQGRDRVALSPAPAPEADAVSG